MVSVLRRAVSIGMRARVPSSIDELTSTRVIINIDLITISTRALAAFIFEFNFRNGCQLA